MQVIIVGGGIAGLSQALSLHQIGVPCRVYDAVPALSPLGYGINLQPNAIRELTFNREPSQAIRRQARLHGMRTLLEDGVVKIVTAPADVGEQLN